MNGVSQKFYNQAKASKIVRDKKFTVLYSGNMGLAQDLKTVIETAASCLKTMKFTISVYWGWRM